MRQLIILTLFLSSAFCYDLKDFINGDASIEPYIFEDTINSTIEGIRPDIPEDILVAELDIDLPDTEAGDAVLIGNGSITNLDLFGLHEFEVTALHFEIIGTQLNLTLHVPVIHLFTNFLLDLLVLHSVPIYGDGDITAHLEDIVVVANAKADLTGTLSVDNLLVQLTLGTAKFDIHGLFNDEELSSLLSSILNDLAVSLVNDNPELITQLLSPIAQDLLNSILGTLLATTTTPLDVTTVGLK